MERDTTAEDDILRLATLENEEQSAEQGDEDTKQQTEKQDENDIEPQAEEQDEEGEEKENASDEEHSEQDNSAEDEKVEALSRNVTRYYEVERGDTLYTISQKIYGDTAYVQKICELNQITDPDNIRYGQKIILP